MVGYSSNDSLPTRVPVKDFVEHVIGRIIDRPEELHVEVVEGERAIVVETRVAPIDAGRVIGRDGRTINALRTLVMAIAARSGKRCVLDVVEIPRVVQPTPDEP